MLRQVQLCPVVTGMMSDSYDRTSVGVCTNGLPAQHGAHVPKLCGNKAGLDSTDRLVALSAQISFGKDVPCKHSGIVFTHSHALPLIGMLH